MKKHFICLVPMAGNSIGLMGQHSTHQPDAQAAEAWAAGRFKPGLEIAIVNMDDDHNGAFSLDSEVAKAIHLDTAKVLAY